MQNNNHFWRCVMCAMLLTLCFAANVKAVTPSPAIVNQIKEEIEMIQYSLPCQAGYGLQLTKVWYIADKYTIAYRYVYDVPTTKPTATAISEVKQGLIHMLKANPDSKDMTYLKNGVTFHYNYYNPDGTFLYAVKLSPADIR